MGKLRAGLKFRSVAPDRNLFAFGEFSANNLSLKKEQRFGAGKLALLVRHRAPDAGGASPTEPDSLANSRIAVGAETRRSGGRQGNICQHFL